MNAKGPQNDASPASELGSFATPASLQETKIERHLAKLRTHHYEFLAAQGDIDSMVAQLRMDGASWARIGATIGISAQAAHQRWSFEGTKKHRIRQRRLHGLSVEDDE